MKNPALAYRQLSIQSSTPLGLVVMLYDGAIAALQRAAAAIEAHDIPKKCDHMNRAQAIILQLEGTLNFEVGGEVAQTLKALYVYARGQMLKANIENSPQVLGALIEKLASVREAWYEADHRPAALPSTPAREVSPGNAWDEGQNEKQTSPPASTSELSPQDTWHEAREEEPPPSPRPARAKSPYATSPSGETGSWRVSA